MSGAKNAAMPWGISLTGKPFPPSSRSITGPGWRSPTGPGATASARTTRRASATGWCRLAGRGVFSPPAPRHNRTVPDLSLPENPALWAKIEVAKHRLFYTLLRLGLPLRNRNDDPAHGLVFDFLADPPQSHAQGVMIGHDNGLIT